MVLYNLFFSNSFKSLILPNDSEIVLDLFIIEEIKSSASTTVPSLLFILPEGKSTIP